MREESWCALPTASATGWVRGLFVLRPVRWAWTDAVRAGGCVGGVVAIGWWAGDVEAGLTASIGALTVLYGRGRPYARRARQLAVIALALTVSGSRTGPWLLTSGFKLPSCTR
jgi:uncharacterized membrane protein YccC